MASTGTAATIHLEVPVFGPSSTAPAVAAGAHRIELNAAGSYPAGGLTPSTDDLRRTSEELCNLGRPVPVRVMIRPRGAPAAGGGMDFIYTAAETEAMEAAVRVFRASGLLSPERGDGFVFGVLRWTAAAGVADGQARLGVNVDCCRRLVRAAGPLKSVFHRAFDELVGNHARQRDNAAEYRGGNAGGGVGEDVGRGGWEAALDDLVACGFDGLLTSGGPGNAAQNAAMLRRVLERAQGRIEVIVGGGVRSTNVQELVGSLGMQGSDWGSQTDISGWVHSSCLTKGNGEEMVDGEEVTRILAAVSN